jgi:hypothetical protein
MKNLFPCAALFLALATVGAAAERDEIPESILLGLKTYQTSSYSVAVELWLKNAAVEQPEEFKKELLGLARAEQIYGVYEGFDVVQQLSFSPRTKRITLVLYFEKGPLWADFDVFRRKDNTWAINGAHLSLSVDGVLRESLTKLSGPGGRSR